MDILRYSLELFSVNTEHSVGPFLWSVQAVPRSLFPSFLTVNLAASVQAHVTQPRRITAALTSSRLFIGVGGTSSSLMKTVFTLFHGLSSALES